MMLKKRAVIINLVFAAVISLFAFFLASAAETNVKFLTGGMYCVKNATTAEWVNYTNPTQRVNALNNCSLYTNITYIENGILKSITQDACCPTSSSLAWCSSSGVCGDGSVITRCDQYRNENDCKNDYNHVGLASIGNASLCGVSVIFGPPNRPCINVTRCGCYWNKESSTCEGRVQYRMDCYGRGILDYGECVWSTSKKEDHCNDSRNNIIITSVARWTSGPPPEEYRSAVGYENCKNITRIYPCIATAKISFFTFANMLVAISLIAVIYALFGRKKH